MKAIFTAYSPGASPLVFCFQDKDNNNAVLSDRTHPVYPSRIKRWLDRNRDGEAYSIYKLDGRWTILANVRRIDDQTVEMNGVTYRYRFLRDIAEDREVWMNDIRVEYQPYHGEAYAELETDDRDQWWQVRNWATRHAIAWFLRYEPILDRARYEPGKRISSSDSWGYQRAIPATVFPDGDGKTIDDD